MKAASGGPTIIPIPWTSRTNPYAQVKSSKSTKLTSILGVKENELANVNPKIVHNIMSAP